MASHYVTYEKNLTIDEIGGCAENVSLIEEYFLKNMAH